MCAESNIRITPLRLSLNAASNAVVVGLDMVTSVLVLAFALRVMTKEVYGLWAEIGGLFAYATLLQLGFDSAITYFIPRGVVHRKPEELNRVVSTALAFYAVVSVVVAVTTVVLAEYVPGWFHVAPELTGTARLLVFMVGGFFALVIPLSVFQGVLGGIQQYVPLNIVRVTGRLVRFGLIVVLLWMGHGLIGLAVGHVAARLAEAFAMPLLVRRYMPGLRIGWSWVSLTTFRQMFGYGIHTVSWIMATIVRYRIGFVVIGLFLNTAAAAVYTIPATILQALYAVVLSISSVTKPAASALHADGKAGQLRSLVIRGVRYTTAALAAMVAFLVVFGDAVVRAWVGDGFEDAPALLTMLLLPQLFALGQSVAAYVITGVGRPRPIGIFTLMMAALSVALMILFVGFFTMGLWGVVLGTALPPAITGTLFLPIYTCRVLDIKLWRYVWMGSVQPLIIILPFVALLIGLRIYIDPQGLRALLAVGGGSGVLLAALFYVWVLDDRARATVRSVPARLRVRRPTKRTAVP